MIGFSSGFVRSQVTLEPGDILYMPRGVVHQADTTDADADGGRGEECGTHSLHATVSTYHRTAWADLLVRASADSRGPRPLDSLC